MQVGVHGLRMCTFGVGAGNKGEASPRTQFTILNSWPWNHQLHTSASPTNLSRGSPPSPAPGSLRDKYKSSHRWVTHPWKMNINRERYGIATGPLEGDRYVNSTLHGLD